MRTNRINLISPFINLEEFKKAAVYAHQHYLSVPYHCPNPDRQDQWAISLTKNGAKINYWNKPKRSQLENGYINNACMNQYDVDKIIYRPNHDLPHSVRQALMVPKIKEFYDNNMPEKCACIETKHLERLQIMLLFAVACRQDETGFHDSDEAQIKYYKKYRSNSAIAFLKYAEKCPGLYSADEQQQLYHDALMVELMGFPNIPDKNILENCKLFKQIKKKRFSVPNNQSDFPSVYLDFLNSAHSLDLLRIYSPDLTKSIINKFLSQFLKHHEKNNSLSEETIFNCIRDIISLLQYSRKLLNESGEKTVTLVELNSNKIDRFLKDETLVEYIRKMLSSNSKDFDEAKNDIVWFLTDKILRKGKSHYNTKRFQYCLNTSEEEVAYAINRLSKVESPLFSNAEYHMHQLNISQESYQYVGGQYVMKSLRTGTDDTSDFFLNGIFNDTYQDIRPPQKGKYTFDGENFIKRKNKAPMYSTKDKQGFSQIQSTSYVNDLATTKIFDFYPNNSNLPKVGVMINERNILVNRCLLNAGGTVDRIFEAKDKNSLKTMREKIFSVPKNYYSKNEWNEFKTAVDKDGTDQTNEVLARVRWGVDFDNFETNSKILIYEDNLCSRLYAINLAEKIKKRLQEQGNILSADLNIPIIFYLPNDSKKHLNYYTPEMQASDSDKVKKQFISNEPSLIYKKIGYEALLALEDSEIFNLLSVPNANNKYPLFVTLIQNKYIALANNLFEKCTIEQQNILIQQWQANFIQGSDAYSLAIDTVEVFKQGYIEFGKKLLGSKRLPPKFWRTCFERAVNPSLVHFLGYSNVLRCLAQWALDKDDLKSQQYWLRIERILEKITPPENQNANLESLYKKLLNKAIEMKQTNVVKLLLLQNINLVKYYLVTYKLNWDYLKFLLEQSDFVRDKNDIDYLLSLAIKNNKFKIACMLLDRGADIFNTKENFLYATVSKNSNNYSHSQDELIKKLLLKGANPNEQVKGDSAYQIIIKGNFIDLFDCLVENGHYPNEETLLYLVRKGKWDFFNSVIRNKGLEILKQKNGILEATQEELLRIFLKNIISSAQNNEDLKTYENILTYAIAAEKNEIFSIFLEEGIEPQYSLPEGWSPLKLAIKTGNEPLIYWLIKQGANLNKIIIDKKTTYDSGYEFIIRTNQFNLFQSLLETQIPNENTIRTIIRHQRWEFLEVLLKKIPFENIQDLSKNKEFYIKCLLYAKAYDQTNLVDNLLANKPAFNDEEQKILVIGKLILDKWPTFSQRKNMKNITDIYNIIMSEKPIFKKMELITNIAKYYGTPLRFFGESTEDLIMKFISNKSMVNIDLDKIEKIKNGEESFLSLSNYRSP